MSIRLIWASHQRRSRAPDESLSRAAATRSLRPRVEPFPFSTSPFRFLMPDGSWKQAPRQRRVPADRGRDGGALRRPAARPSRRKAAHSSRHSSALYSSTGSPSRQIRGGRWRRRRYPPRWRQEGAAIGARPKVARGAGSVPSDRRRVDTPAHLARRTWPRSRTAVAAVIGDAACPGCRSTSSSDRAVEPPATGRGGGGRARAARLDAGTMRRSLLDERGGERPLKI